MTVLHIPCIQDDDLPSVKELQGIGKKIILLWIYALKIVYNLPECVYCPLEKITSYLLLKIWNARIIIFHVQQIGIVNSGKRLSQKIKNKISGKT